MKVAFESVEEALSQPLSKYFWISREDTQVRCGNRDSFYSKSIFDKDLTFDISNNKVLANVSVNGFIKHLSVYRKSYEVDSIPGVWYFKDFTKTGPYYLSLKIGEKRWDLNKVDWPLKTGLLDNIFPITELKGAGLKIKLITYAPVSDDGKVRPRVLIYGVFLENVSNDRIQGAISLRMSSSICSTSMPSIHIKLLDGLDYNGEAGFYLEPDSKKWLPFIISAIPRQEQLQEEMEKKTSLEWLNSTWCYFRGITGYLEMPQDRFTQEFFERAIHQCVESIGITETGEIAGSNLGTYPTTNAIWMKDMYYSYLPFYLFEPEFFKKGILWFLDKSVRYESSRFKGGITHSLSNALTPVIMCGLYYSTTGDREFFKKNPEMKFKIKEILEQVVNSRKGDVWLFPSEWISDGPSLGDYHTGSNLVAWYCFKFCARIMREIYSDRFTADQYLEVAEKIKKDIEKHNVIDGPFGRQYVEGVNVDGNVPCMVHDGEESDTTLMPVYGYLDYDDPKYKNYTRFALTEQNLFYSSESKGIKWFDFKGKVHAGATFPGYITGFASITNEEEMNGKQGYMTVIRQLTDMDGSIWWWPYPKNSEYGKVKRGQASKCAWASGVFAVLFISEFLGIKYDAPQRKLQFRPFSPSSNFQWKCLKIGKAFFDVSYQREEKKILVSIKNLNQFSIFAEYTIILEKNAQVEEIEMNRSEYKDEFKYGKFFGSSTIIINTSIDTQQKKTFEVKYL